MIRSLCVATVSDEEVRISNLCEETLRSRQEECSTFLAEFLSARISTLRQIDQTMKDSLLNSEDDERQFEITVSLQLKSQL
jgi:hypothetical protein